jgi:hypothetical protein
MICADGYALLVQLEWAGHPAPPMRAGSTRIATMLAVGSVGERPLASHLLNTHFEVLVDANTLLGDMIPIADANHGWKETNTIVDEQR